MWDRAVSQTALETLQKQVYFVSRIERADNEVVFRPTTKAFPLDKNYVRYFQHASWT